MREKSHRWDTRAASPNGSRRIPVSVGAAGGEVDQVAPSSAEIADGVVTAGFEGLAGVGLGFDAELVGFGADFGFAGTGLTGVEGVEVDFTAGGGVVFGPGFSVGFLITIFGDLLAGGFGDSGSVFRVGVLSAGLLAGEDSGT